MNDLLPIGGEGDTHDAEHKAPALTGAGIGLAMSVAAAALFFDLPTSRDATAASTPAETPAIPVTVAKVESRDVMRWEEFSGRLEAVDRVQIRSRVAGQIKAVHFREGALVKEGDPLFTIDPAPIRPPLPALKDRSPRPKPRSALRKRNSTVAAGFPTTAPSRRAISTSARARLRMPKPSFAPPAQHSPRRNSISVTPKSAHLFQAASAASKSPPVTSSPPVPPRRH